MHKIIAHTLHTWYDTYVNLLLLLELEVSGQDTVHKVVKVGSID